MVGRTPWSARVPPDPLSARRIKRSRHRDRPTGASAADQGVRPTVFQNEILALNCSFRGWLAMVVTVPNVAESMFVPGAAKCTALLRLKASACMASLTVSRIWNSLRTLRSRSALCGANSPNGAERAMLPTVYAAGSTNAVLSRYGVDVTLLPPLPNEIGRAHV